jgi:D-lactate dehydrogenase
MFDVFFFEAFEEEADLLRQKIPAGIVAGFSADTIQEYGDPHPPARIISIRTQSLIPVPWAPRLAGVLTRSTGYDHLAGYRKETGDLLPCGYLPTYCARAVAEQAALLWLALLRRLPSQTSQMHSFDRDGLTGCEAAGQCLVIFGVGNIGYEIAGIGRGLGMEVRGVDIVKRHPDISYVTPDEGVAQAKVIACAMNLNQSNHAYFNYKRLLSARADCVFVNVARGEMSPSSELLRLMKENRLGGIGLDVFDHESELATSLRSKRPSEDPEVQAFLELQELPRVIATPHNAFNTIEALNRKAEQSVAEIVQFAGKGVFSWPIPP